MILKKPKDLTDIERKIIDWAITGMLVIAIVYFSTIAILQYKEGGWAAVWNVTYCVIEDEERVCFDTREERDIYAQIYPQIYDNNYINNYTNISLSVNLTET